MAKAIMTVEKAILLKNELEVQVLGMLNEYSRKTGLVLKTVKINQNAEAYAEVLYGQLTFLEDVSIYLTVDILGEI